VSGWVAQCTGVCVGSCLFLSFASAAQVCGRGKSGQMSVLCCQECPLMLQQADVGAGVEGGAVGKAVGGGRS